MPSLGVSRLAPSPSGPLHLGNACTFLVNWALARRLGWRLLLRIEDLDQPRARLDAEASILRSLAWLGIDHDGAGERQSLRGGAYERAMEALARDGFVFESPHSRAQVRAAGGDEEALPSSAPHAGAAAAFPRSLRPAERAAWRFVDRRVNHRFRVPDQPVVVDDQVLGRHSIDLAREMGDFIVWSKAGVAGYQLAVVVDDAESGVTDVVRGADLLPSAAAQQCVLSALGHPIPRWWHLPLVVDDEGRRLSKRDGDLSLESLQSRGVEAERVIGLFAHWIGLSPAPLELDAAAFRDACDPERVRAWAKAAPPRLGVAELEWLHTR